nr:iron uptake transporter permease EfeU [Schaalia sp. lx-100]
MIALREGVEASLIVGIILAYLAKVGRKDLFPQVALGTIIAVLVPLSLGAYMTWGPYTLSFAAQEIIGGGLSLVAVAMVTWMILWMSKNSHALTEKLRSDTNAALKTGSTWGIVWIAVVAVGREGIETALFVWATVKSSATNSVIDPTLGVLTGLIVAVLIGWAVYTGAARINLSLFFNITGLLLIFVAAGVMSYGIGDFQEANVLPGWGVPIYDFTYLVDGSLASWLNTSAWWWVLLEAMFNLNAAPTHLQFFAWLIYIVSVLPIFLVRSRICSPADRPSAVAHSHAETA